jgi:Fic family protein
MKYQPPYTITPEILNRVAAISEAIGRLTVLTDQARALRLRRINRIRTIHGSLAIEGNTLSEAQITAILEGKRVIAPPREVQEVKNALAAYDRFDTWKPEAEKDLLEAHRILMSGLIDEAGLYRHGGVGVMAGQEVIHMAPPADRVPQLMADLFGWLAVTPVFCRRFMPRESQKKLLHNTVTTSGCSAEPLSPMSPCMNIRTLHLINCANQSLMMIFCLIITTR